MIMADIRRLALAQGLIPDHANGSGPMPPAALWLAESSAWLSRIPERAEAQPAQPVGSPEPVATGDQGDADERTD